MPYPPEETRFSVLKQSEPKCSIFHFLHTYKKVGDIRVVRNLLPATYEDWACVHPGCNHIIRKSILSPPTRRIESRPVIVNIDEVKTESTESGD